MALPQHHRLFVQGGRGGVQNVVKAAAGKAYEFASSVKDKLDGTAQKAKRVAEDEAEYPYTLFLSPPFPPRLSLCLPL